jgi:hypothetical protein
MFVDAKRAQYGPKSMFLQKQQEERELARLDGGEGGIRTHG